MRQEDILFQSVNVVREEKNIPLDLSFLKEATFVETIDLSGPRLMMTFADPDSIIRDDIGLKQREVLEVRIADVWEREGIDQKMYFVIWTMPNKGDLITINCIQRNIDLLKIPAKETMLFTKKPAGTIIKKLIPNLKYDVGNFPALEDYHLLPGERPSLLLRQMAKEAGAFCFYRRGKLVYKKMSDLKKQEPKYTYEYNNQMAENQIIHYARPNATAIIKDRVERNKIGWNMEKGIVRSGKQTSKPPEIVSVSNLQTMGNLLQIPYPAIDFMAVGNGACIPGMKLSLKWNMDKKDAPLDESMPSWVIVSTVAHYYSAQKYFMRVKGVTIQ